MTQPEAEMLPFEQEPVPPSETFSSVAEMAAAIRAAAERRQHRDAPDATDRWLEETGGGGRKDDLMQDPPRTRVPHTAPASMSADGLVHDSYIDPHWNQPVIPETDEERRAAATQREGTSLQLIDSSAADARRLDAAGGDESLARALKVKQLRNRSRSA